MAERFYIDSSVIFDSEAYSEDGTEIVEANGLTWRAVDPLGRPFIDKTFPLSPIAQQTFIPTQKITYGVFPGPATLPGSSSAIASTTFNPFDVGLYTGTTWTNIGSAKNILTGNAGQLIIPPIAFKLPGLYTAVANFTLANGIIVSVPESVEIIDPLAENSPEGLTTADLIIDHAWMKLEDLFDSEDSESGLGGPWLRDKTFKVFNRDKLARFLPDALYLINNEFQPVTDFDEVNWPVAHVPLASQALMLEGIYHLIRSYVEQPMPAGGQIAYFDRRDYMARWQSVLQSENDKLMKLMDVFKLQYTGFGSTSILVGGYATPITRLSRFWRTRYPRYIGPWGF